MKKIIFFALLFVFCSTVVRAADIRNQDDKKYQLVIKQSGRTFATVLEAKGYIKNLCSACTVEVVGFSLLDIDNEPEIVVSDGVLKVK